MFSLIQTKRMNEMCQPLNAHLFRGLYFELRREKTCFLNMGNQRRSAADQRLCFRYTDRTILLLPKSENLKHLAIFCGCTAQFVTDLVGNHEDRFSCETAFDDFLAASA